MNNYPELSRETAETRPKTIFLLKRLYDSESELSAKITPPKAKVF